MYAYFIIKEPKTVGYFLTEADAYEAWLKQQKKMATKEGDGHG